MFLLLTQESLAQSSVELAADLPACTLHASPGGPLPRPGPGDVVCFAAGTYPPLVIDTVHGTPGAPIVFRPSPGAATPPSFSSNTLEHGAAITARNSSHIQLHGLRATRASVGVRVESSAHLQLYGLLVESVGQAGIEVCRERSGNGRRDFLGGPSHHVDIVGSTIRHTGLVEARFGEGIYVGTGGLPGDDTHHVRIEGNDIQHVRAEGIDVKAYTHDILVRGNLVAHGSHYFHAAITVGVNPRACPGPADYVDGNYVIEDNVVFDFRRTPPPAGDLTSSPVAGIGVGQGNAVLRRNIVWDVPGGAAIEVYPTFGNPLASRVTLAYNSTWNPAGREVVVHEDGQGSCATGQAALVGAGAAAGLPLR